MNHENKHSLVLVDDEPWALIGMRQIIPWEEHGFAIVGTYESAEEALEALRAHPADAIITDIRLPEMNGIELTEILFHEGLVHAACMVSAYRDFEYARKGMEHGACYYLLKPLAIGEVKKAAAKLLQKVESHTGPHMGLLDSVQFGMPNVFVSCIQAPEDILTGSLKQVSCAEDGVFMYGCQSPGDCGKPWIGRSRIHSLPVTFKQMHHEACLSSALCFAFSENALVSETQLDIAEHYADKLLIPEIAARHYVSAVYLSDCFKRDAGITIGNFIIHVRIEVAKKSLRHTKSPISEIAMQVGYPDASYFSRLFRRRVGQSPESYRTSQ